MQDSADSVAEAFRRIASTEECRRKYATRSAMLIPAVSSATASFHLRLSATASKPGIVSGCVGFGIDDFLGADDTDWRPTFQQIHRIETILAPHIDKMLEVPTHDQADAMHTRHRDVQGIIREFPRHHIGNQINRMTKRNARRDIA